VGETVGLGRPGDDRRDRVRDDHRDVGDRSRCACVRTAIIPLVAVALGATGVLEHRTAVQLALWLGVATLAAQGIRYARLEHLHPAATIATIGLNLAIGLALVALEVLIAR
jgi:hypothetical protein